MWSTSCSSSTSSVGSASACESEPSDAAPKIVRVLSWPVRPKGAFTITEREYLLMDYDLVAVGDVILDAILPEPVPGRRIHGRIELRAGGSAANAALAAAGLGAPAAVLGRVGGDTATKPVTGALVEAGVAPRLVAAPAAASGCRR